MIAFYLTYDYDARGKCHGATAHRYDGTITFIAGSHAVVMPTNGELGKYHKRRNRVTVFDDSHNPPKLIREDYEIAKLRKFKYLELPKTYIDETGSIVNTRGEVLFAGPKHA